MDELTLEGGAGEVAAVFAITKVAALAYLAFNLFSPPCFAAIGAMSSEINNRKWFWAGIGLQLAVGYSLGFLVFFFGTLFANGSFGSIWMPIVGWLIFAAIALILLGLILKAQKNLKGESR